MSDEREALKKLPSFVSDKKDVSANEAPKAPQPQSMRTDRPGLRHQGILTLINRPRTADLVKQKRQQITLQTGQHLPTLANQGHGVEIGRSPATACKY